MNNKITNHIKSFAYTLSSNIISMVISAFVTLVMPKLIGINDYGFWQLYLFYSSYVGLLHLGWNDGIYLRYGGKEYKEIDKRLFFTQFYMLLILQEIIVLIIFFIAKIKGVYDNELFILKMLTCSLIIGNMRCMLLYILQGTNRLKDYAWITMIDRIIYLFFISIFILGGIKNYKLIIFADISAKSFSLLYSIYCCRDIVFRKISTFYFSFEEMLQNINVGIKLMFANIASLLIIGVVRFGIERSWDIIIFGKISLTFSISNFFMLFINAIALVFFPILKKVDTEKLSDIYCIMRDFLMIISFGVLIFYYPIKVLLSIWLPKYADSLKYMAILFPMCVYEGKMALLINTYLKSLRREKLLLSVNFITLSVSIVITFITTYLMKNLNLTVMSIVVFLAFRCIIAEISLSRILSISVSKDIIMELYVTTIFIISGWYINSWLVIVIYGTSYIFYLLKKRNDVRNAIQNIKALVRA